MEDLEFAFDEPGEEPRSHRRRKKKRRGRSWLALVLTVVILGALGGGAWYGANKLGDLFSTPDYSGAGSGTVTVKISAGESGADIGNTLFKADVVKSAKAFVEATKVNQNGNKVQPGTYTLRKQMRAQDALSMLLNLDNKLTTKVPIREGLTYKATFAELEKYTKIPAAQFEEAAKDPIALGVPDFWFNRNDGKTARKSLEGFLYPSTYEFEPGFTATSILKEMVGQFLKVATQIDFVAKVQAERHISPFEALTVASLAQAEAGVPGDLGKVARVAYNRVYGDANMPLEFDVCANYWLTLNGKPSKHSSDMTAAEIDDPANPYNVKSVRGLPAGPIDSPGKEAMLGAMNPPPGKWLYFVAIDTAGNSAFAETLKEQLANEAKARANGALK